MKPLLYGACQHSLASIYDGLQPFAKKYQAKVRVVDSELKSGDIYLFPTFKVFSKFSKQLEGKPGVVIIVDSPLQLVEVVGLKIIDMEDRKPDLSFMFRMKALNKSVFRSVVKKALDNPPKLKFKFQEYELIPKLLDTVQQGHFLDKFSTLLYSVPLASRNKIRLAITSYLFDSVSLVNLKKKLTSYFRKGLSLTYAEKVMDYLESPDGKKLHVACQHISKKRSGKRKQVPYKSIAKKFEVPHYELKYLSKMYRTSLKEDVFQPSELKRVPKKEAQKPIESGVSEL